LVEVIVVIVEENTWIKIFRVATAAFLTVKSGTTLTDWESHTIKETSPCPLEPSSLSKSRFRLDLSRFVDRGCTALHAVRQLFGGAVGAASSAHGHLLAPFDTVNLPVSHIVAQIPHYLLLNPIAVDCIEQGYQGCRDKHQDGR
jgi:hypothetical protein